jgi:hypothetical protein
MVKIALALLLATVLTLPSMAREAFGSDEVRFDRDTVMEFEFVQSQGIYQSVFGVIEVQSGFKTPLLVENKPFDRVDTPGAKTSYIGTPGNAVTNPLAKFTFRANILYAFYLESTYKNKRISVLYSLDDQNPQGRQRLIFEGGLETLGNGGVRLRWDDGAPRSQEDFNDFIVQVGGFEACAVATGRTSPP